MAVITMPTNIYLGRQAYRQRRYDILEVSEPTGKQSARVFGPPRWGVSFASTSPTSMENGRQFEALLMRLRGGVNVLAMWDFNKPAPLGTMRGTPTLASTAAAGATVLALAGAGVSKTLLAGDWLQVGTGHGTSQLFKVVVDVTLGAGGTGNVTVEPPVRKQLNSASVVLWDKSLGYYRMTGQEFAWNAVPGAILTEGYSVELLEDFG